MTERIAVVIIGRNEGDRLVKCLESVASLSSCLVYVDSGSTDDSCRNAEAFGAKVVALDMSLPFSAARARNAGFESLVSSVPDIEFVQFVDGDCIVDAAWPELASRHLTNHPDCAIVCGRRTELYPEKSVYNRLCDIEWDTPTGQTDACGGDFLVRAAAFSAIGGFNPALIAGEEPEMCHRLTSAQWSIYRLDAPMTYHDADMTRFTQWARRSSRSGYAYAAQAILHWRDGTHFKWRENISNLAWALALPTAIVFASTAWSPWFAILFLLYPLYFARILNYQRARIPFRDAVVYSAFLVLTKWTESYGQMLFLLRKAAGSKETLIEYKTTE